MRFTKNLLLFLLLIGSVATCVEQPKYNVVPEIKLLDITFKRGDLTKGVQDTLIFRLTFKDGDGDLGVTSADSTSFDSRNPWYFFYNPSNLSAILYSVDPAVQLPAGYKIINYHAKKTIQQFDTLPALVCGSWELLRNAQSQPTDTVYIRQNLKAYNVNVDVFAKDNNGNYVPYNYATPNYDFTNCSYNLFRATFPDLSNDRQTALDGVITFRISSFYLYSFFNTRTLKMDITINDRAFHVSKPVSKEDFTILQITK